MRYIIAFISILLLSCGNDADQVASAVDSTIAPSPDSIVAANEVPEVLADSIIVLKFARDSITTSAKGHVNKKGDPVICLLSVKQGKKLSGAIIPEKAGANIRFSHIVMPDGTTDGPFGQTIEYRLKLRGVYKLYIAPNRMAGDPVATDFTVRVKVQ